MLINVKTAQPIWLFIHQKMRKWFLGNYKKRGGKFITRLNRRREKQKVGSKWTPLMHLSVKKGVEMFYFEDLITEKVMKIVKIEKLILKTKAIDNLLLAPMERAPQSYPRKCVNSKTEKKKKKWVKQFYQTRAALCSDLMTEINHDGNVHICE